MPWTAALLTLGGLAIVLWNVRLERHAARQDTPALAACIAAD